MAGLIRPIQIDLNHGSSYNNAHTIIMGCHISGTYECIKRVAGGAGTAYDFRFIGCDFHDSHDADHMLDMTNLHYSTFWGCNTELHATTPPAVSVIECGAIGIGFHNCLFGGRDIGAVVMLDGSGSYMPVDVAGCTFANWYAGQTLMDGGTFTNVDSCYFYNNAATIMGAGTYRKDHTKGVISATQPTLTYDGEMVVWEDSDAGPKRWLVCRINGADYKCEIQT
jgi:hypothetical protein